jgi:hypothetical protein
MPDSPNDPLLAYVEHIVAQLTKNGYPERRVAFPIERMYESAAAKGLSFNKVLEVLAERGIGHEKTPEKVIFCPAVVAPAIPAAGAFPGAGGFPGADAFAGFDPSMLAGLSPEQLIAAAQAAMQQMGPEQLEAMRRMVEGMTPEQQAAMMEQAKKMGLL